MFPAFFVTATGEPGLALNLEQLLNGLQLGVTLFLLAAGLTLVFRHYGRDQPAHGSP